MFWLGLMVDVPWPCGAVHRAEGVVPAHVLGVGACDPRGRGIQPGWHGGDPDAVDADVDVVESIHKREPVAGESGGANVSAGPFPADSLRPVAPLSPRLGGRGRLR